MKTVHNDTDISFVNCCPSFPSVQTHYHTKISIQCKKKTTKQNGKQISDMVGYTDSFSLLHKQNLLPFPSVVFHLPFH